MINLETEIKNPQRVVLAGQTMSWSSM